MDCKKEPRRSCIHQLFLLHICKGSNGLHKERETVRESIIYYYHLSKTKINNNIINVRQNLKWLSLSNSTVTYRSIFSSFVLSPSAHRLCSQCVRHLITSGIFVHMKHCHCSFVFVIYVYGVCSVYPVHMGTNCCHTQ